MLDRVLRIVILYDAYGALLTDKQRSSLEMHYLNDFSLAEIADELGISRQAVHDNLKRVEQILIDYEEKLKFVERHQRDQQTLQHIYGLVEALPKETRLIPEMNLVAEELQSLLD